MPFKKKSKSKTHYGFKIYSPSGNLIAKGTPKKSRLNKGTSLAMAKREGRQELYSKHTPIGSKLVVEKLSFSKKKKGSSYW